MIIVVSTYSRHDLAALVVRSVRALTEGVTRVVVLDASGTMRECDGADEVRHVPFGRHAGCFAAIAQFPGEPVLCLDDDVVLIAPLNVARYVKGLSKPPNGHMVCVVRPGVDGHERLEQKRVKSFKDIPDRPWSQAAGKHRCELIDGVWLHIDRGSEGPNANRELVVGALSAPGAGTHLKTLLRRMGFTADAKCKCAKRAALMDANGPKWCRESLDLISSWLAEEAANRTLPYSHTAGKALILLAIRRAEKGNGH